MGRLAEAYVDISANLKPMEAGLAKAKVSLASFAKTGVSLGVGVGLGAGGGIAGGLLSAAKRAADLGESLSKVRVTFGKDADGLVAQADRLAQKYGIVKQETLDAAASFGLMGRAAGLSTQASAKLGEEFVQLGVDLASFHNISNEEAFLKLRSGLAGEAEPLRPLGILLSEDAVKAEALAMGLVKVKRELTEQEKVLARVSLISKQAGPAIGDRNRTADSTMNQYKKLIGELENAAVSLGKELEGAFAGGIQGATTMLHLLQEGAAALKGENKGFDLFHAGSGKYLARTQENATEGGFSIFLNPNARRDPRQAPTPAPTLVGALAGAMAQAQQVRDAKEGGRAAFEQREAVRVGAQVAANEGITALGQTLGLEPGAQQLLTGNIPGALGQIAKEQQERKDAETNQHNREVEQREARTPFQSQGFSSGSEFATFAIQKALSDPEDEAKKQTELLTNSAGALNDLRTIGADLIEMVRTAPPLRAILRGAS